MAAPLLAALLLLLDLALAIRLDDRFQPSRDRIRAAVLSEGDVIFRKEEAHLNVSRPVVDIFFAFDTSLGMVKRRIMVRSSMDQLRFNFMDGEEGRDKIAWRFFSDDELPDVRFVQQPPEIRKPQGKRPVYKMLRRWLHDLSWSRRHYDLRWMVRADDDGVLCPNNFARFTEGLRTLQPAPRKSLRAPAVKPWLDSWTEEQLQSMHEDYPRPTLAISVPCSTDRTLPFQCMPSAEEQYKRQVRMFEPSAMTGDLDRDFSFKAQDWEENFIVVTPEFVEDLMEKVESSPECQPTEEEYINHYLQRLLEGDCSAKQWPQELTIVNMGRWDALSKDGAGMSSWGHNIWNSAINHITFNFTSLKEFQTACKDYEVVWFHHVCAKDLHDIIVPESLQWLDELQETYKVAPEAPGWKRPDWLPAPDGGEAA